MNCPQSLYASGFEPDESRNLGAVIARNWPTATTTSSQTKELTGEGILSRNFFSICYWLPKEKCIVAAWIDHIGRIAADEVIALSGC
jgi:hypothetical protein